MKTYPEILNETIEYYIRHEVSSKATPEETAAKEYAKQWLDKVQVGIPDVTSWAYRNIIKFKHEIDSQ